MGTVSQKEQINGELILARCFLRMSRGQGDIRNQCRLTGSKLYVTYRGGEETYSLKSFSGVRRHWFRPWWFLVLGIVLAGGVFTALQAREPPPPPPTGSRVTWINRPPAQPGVNDPDLAPLPQAPSGSSGEGTGSAIFFTLALGVSVFFIVLGASKQEQLVLELDNGNLKKFRVHTVSSDYEHFIETLKQRLG